MNLYDVALTIFVKRVRTEHANEKSQTYFLSEAQQSIEVAKLFMQAVEADKAKAVEAVVFPEAEL